MLKVVNCFQGEDITHTLSFPCQNSFSMLQFCKGPQFFTLIACRNQAQMAEISQTNEIST
jgi:hypothetical protein